MPAKTLTNSEINIDAYGILFQLENLIRLKLNLILSNNYGSNYFVKNKFMVSKNKKNKDLYDNANGRKNSEVIDKVPNAKNTPLLFYVDFGDLGRIMKNEWSKIQSFFPHQYSIDKIVQMFDSLEKIRNRIAHNRPIREIELNEIEITYDYFSIHFENLSIEDVYPKTKKNIDLEIKQVEHDLWVIFSSIENSKSLQDNWERVFFECKILLATYGTFMKEQFAVLNNLIDKIKGYKKIPRLLGSYDKIVKYTKGTNLITDFNFFLKEYHKSF